MYNVEEIKELVKSGKSVGFVVDNLGWSESLVIGRYKGKYLILSLECSEEICLYDSWEELGDEVGGLDILEEILEKGYEMEVYDNIDDIIEDKVEYGLEIIYI